MERSYNDRNKTLANVEKQEDELKHRIQTLTEAAAVAERDNGSAESEGNDAMAAKHGSKPAALVRHLQKLIKKGHQTIVFSYWHDTLKLIQATLKKCDIPSVFCDGRHTAEALSVFTSGNVKVILLSAQSKASGANLQCATHVALLDPAGQSAEHGSTLEEQAIGRAVRMGQEHQVTVTRFCVVGTLEETMFEQIDQAHTKALERASDDKYVIKDSSKVSTKEKANTQEENDATEVVVTAALTQEERLQCDYEEAQKDGRVIDLLDTDGEDDASTEASINKRHGSERPRCVRIKQEPDVAAASRNEPICATPTKKRSELELSNHPEYEPGAKRLCREVSTSGESADSGDVGDLHEPVVAQTASTPAHAVARTTISPDIGARLAVTQVQENEPRQPAPMRDDDSIEQFLARCGLRHDVRLHFHQHDYLKMETLYRLAHNLDAMEGVMNTILFPIPGDSIRFCSKLLSEAEENGYSKKPYRPERNHTSNEVTAVHVRDV